MFEVSCWENLLRLNLEFIAGRLRALESRRIVSLSYCYGVHTGGYFAM